MLFAKAEVIRLALRLAGMTRNQKIETAIF
jgi:hypothetical protein